MVLHLTIPFLVFFTAIDTEKFESLFRECFRGTIPYRHGAIAFDGKTIRGTYESEDDKVNRKADRKGVLATPSYIFLTHTLQRMEYMLGSN